MDQMFHKTTHTIFNVRVGKEWMYWLARTHRIHHTASELRVNHPSSRDLGTIIGLPDVRRKSPRILSNEK